MNSQQARCHHEWLESEYRNRLRWERKYGPAPSAQPQSSDPPPPSPSPSSAEPPEELRAAVEAGMARLRARGLAGSSVAMYNAAYGTTGTTTTAAEYGAKTVAVDRSRFKQSMLTRGSS